MSGAQRETSVIPRFDIREHRRPAIPGYAYAGVILAISQAIFLFIVRLLAVMWNYDGGLDDPRFDVVLVLGGLLAVGIIPAAVTVGLGLAAMREAWRDNFRHSLLGAIAFGSGCLLIVLWVSRMVIAVVGVIGEDEYLTFASVLFLWA